MSGIYPLFPFRYIWKKYASDISQAYPKNLYGYQMSTIIAMIAMQSELETILSSSTSVGIELPAINLFKEPHWI